MNDYTTTQRGTSQVAGAAGPTGAPANGPTGAARTRRNTRIVVGALTLSGVAIAGAVAAFAMALSSPAGAHTVAPTPPAAPSVPAVVPSVPVTPYVPPVAPVTPVQPSASITTLQQQLGQLNYYEGPVDGLMNPQLSQAISYLQRDAGLPQTGVMNSATSSALATMLATGNNHMAG